MLKRLLFVIFSVVTLNSQMQAQCPGSFACDAAGVLCSIDQLNGFRCNNPLAPNTQFPFPTLCFGVGVPHNLNWWAFVGNGSALTLTFNFDPASCEQGQGIQAGVFEGSCDGSTVWDCNAGCNTSTFSLSGGTSNCETYYVWVDGCNGDVCTYTMSVNGFGGPPMLPPLRPLMTRDPVCPCNMFEVCAPDLGDCLPTFEWTVNGIAQGRDECIFVDVPSTAAPGSRINVCLKATIGNPDNPAAVCDQDSICTPFIVAPIDMIMEPCEVVCFEDQPFVWQGFPIASSCIVPPCSTRVEGPDGCCDDVTKAIILLSPPGIGMKDTFICNVGIPYVAENGRVYSDEVCNELVEYKRRVIHPQCPSSIQMCDTSYFLNIGRFKYSSDPEFDCAACSGQVTIGANVEYDPDCPTYLGQVSVLLNWYNELNGDRLGTTDGLGTVNVSEPGRICAEIEASFRGQTCIILPAICLDVPGDLFPDDPPITGDTVICAERYGRYETQDQPDRCDFIWTVQSGGGRIVGTNTLDSTGITVDWSNRTGTEGVVCVEMRSDCGTTDSCITVTFLPAPNPDAGPDQIICGLQTNFEGVPDFGGGMWTQVGGPRMANIDSPSDVNSLVAADDYGTYTFIFREENLDCDGVDTVEILFAPDPEPNNIDTICSGDATEFIVRFEINRGTLPYTITQGAGMIVNDSIFVSDTILDNTPTTITIEDENGCEFTYFIDHDCVCDNAPGEMSMDTIKNCGPDGIACGDYDPTNMILETPLDTFQYVLYTTQGNILGTALSINFDGCFGFDPATMQLNTVYYIGVIVGRKGQDDSVNPNGGCLQPAEAQPVIWYQIPTPNAGIDTAVCGQVINLGGTLSMNGTTYRWLNTAGAVINDQDDLNTSVTVAPGFGTFEFVLEEVNAICPATDTVAITFNESPTGSPVETCLDYEKFTFNVCFEIMRGLPPYRIVSGTGTIDPVTNEYCSDSLDSGPYTIIIEDANGCQFVLNDRHECDCGITDPGNMDGAEEACIDECIEICSNMSEVVQADEETFFVLHQGSGAVLVNEITRKLYDHTANPCQPIEFCFDDNTMTPGVTYYVSRLVREINNLDDPCERISPGQPVTWNAYPNADPGSNQDFCGLEGSLSATPSIGNGSWVLVNSPMGSNAIFGSALPAGMVTVDQYGSYTFRWTEDNRTCRDSAEVTLTFHDAPIISNVSFECDSVAENYRITFDITGGDPASYEIGGASVTSSHTTGWYRTGTAASLCVTDQWDCSPACLDTMFVCTCLTEPGVVTSDDALCIDECVNADYQGGVLDPNDIARFVLHDGDANTIGTILECNDSGEFCFDQFAMTANTTYYITVVAGNPDGVGCVDQNERCAVQSNGVPVTWYEYPSPDITQSEPQFTCQIDSMILDGAASTGPGAISYQWRALTGTICPSSSTTAQSIFICNPGSFILTVTHDISGCATSDTIDILSDENIPNVSAGNDLELTCDRPVVTLDATGTDNGGDFEIQWFDPNGDPIPNGDVLQIQVTTPGTYTIRVNNTVTDCDNSDEVVVTENVEQPEAMIDQLGTLTCTVNEIDLDAVSSVTQGGVRSYDWSTPNGTIVGSRSTARITIGDPGDYQLIIVDDRNGCTDTVAINIQEVGNTLATWDIDPTPPRCFGESNGEVTINGITGGTTPLEYSFNGGAFSNLTEFGGLSAGTYNVSVRDANGCEKDTIIVIPETPDIDITAEDDMIKEAGDDINLDSLIQSIFGIDPMEADSILWYDNDSSTYLGRWPNSIPINDLKRRHTFRVELWNNGCFKSDLITIFVKFTKRVYIPNVIVPDANNIENTYLTIHANKERIKNINFLRVYDRWGEIIYSKDDVMYDDNQGRSTEGWNGRFDNIGEFMLPGVYVYHAQIEFLGGSVEDYYGDVTLLLQAGN